MYFLPPWLQCPVTRRFTPMEEGAMVAAEAAKAAAASAHLAGAGEGHDDAVAEVVEVFGGGLENSRSAFVRCLVFNVLLI